MSVDEALRTLGIEPGLDDQAVRRAYLSKIKLHKPESDPEGFRRVREAYELLRDAGSQETFEAPFLQLVPKGDSAADAAPEAGPADPPGLELGSAPLALTELASAEGPRALLRALQAGDGERALRLWMRLGPDADDVMTDDGAWTLTFSLEANGDAERADVAYALWRASSDRKADARSANPILRRLSEEYFTRRQYLVADARVMISQALLDQDWEAVPARLMRYRNTAGAEARRSMQQVIGASTPVLLKMLGLKEPPPWTPPVGPGVQLSLLSFVVLMLLRFLPQMMGPRDEPPRLLAPSARHQIEQSMSERPDPRVLARRRPHTGDWPGDPSALLVTLPPDGELPLGFPIGRLRLAAGQENCPYIRSTLAHIERDLDVRSIQDSRVRRQLEPFKSTLRRECP